MPSKKTLTTNTDKDMSLEHTVESTLEKGASNSSGADNLGGDKEAHNNLHLLADIRIVLVHTRHPGNIGGAARAMKNMGLKQLYLVEPKQFPDDQAQARAASADDILAGAVVCESLEQALEGCRLVVGSSARERRIPWPLMDSRSAAEKAVSDMLAMRAAISNQDSSSANSLDINADAALKNNKQAPIAILFGREDRGLTNEELQCCNYHMTIPTNEDYSSLNLAAAVQVFCYELRMAALQNYTLSVDWDVPAASSDNLQRYFEHLEKVLVDIDFIDAKAPRQTMTRLRRLYNRVRPDEMELAMLRGMLTQIEKTIAAK